MTKIVAGIVALMIMGAAALPLQARAAEQKPGLSNVQSTDISARRYWGPRYGYGYPYPYYYRPYYYQPAPFVPFGFGPFGLRVF